jgi:hypothetical protein
VSVAPVQEVEPVRLLPSRPGGQELVKAFSYTFGLPEGEIAPEKGGAYISERLIHLQRASPEEPYIRGDGGL